MRKFPESPEAFLKTMNVLEHTAKAAHILRKMGYVDAAQHAEHYYEKELGITIHERAAVRKEIQAVLTQEETVVEA